MWILCAEKLGFGGSFSRLYEHKTASGSPIHEFDGAGDLGEEGVIFAATHVGAWLNAGATLANDNCAARDKLSTECLNA